MMKTKIACVAMLLVVVGLVAAQTRPHKVEPVDIPVVPEATLTDLNTGQTWEWAPPQASQAPLLQMATTPPDAVIECGVSFAEVAYFEPISTHFQIVITCNGDPDCGVTLWWDYDCAGEYPWFIPCTMFNACDTTFGFAVGSTHPLDRAVVANGAIASVEVQQCE